MIFFVLTNEKIQFQINISFTRSNKYISTLECLDRDYFFATQCFMHISALSTMNIHLTLMQWSVKQKENLHSINFVKIFR